MYCMFSMESPNNRLLWDIETDLYKKVKLCINFPSGLDKLSILMYVYICCTCTCTCISTYMCIHHVHVHVHVLLPFYSEHFS